MRIGKGEYPRMLVLYLLLVIALNQEVIVDDLFA